MRHPLPDHKPQRGMIVVQVTLCLMALMGVAALALDGGLLLAERQRAKAVADAAALAAAIDLANNYSSLTVANPDGGTSAKTNAVKVAESNYGNNSNDGTTTTPSYTVNGTTYQTNSTTFTTGGPTPTTCTVEVNIPPKSGQFTNPSNYPGYVEVIVTYDQPRYFSGIFGSGTLPVKARAVARGINASVGLLLLGKNNENPDLSLSVTASLHTAGTIIVDSNASGAVTNNSTSTAGILSDTAIYIVGNKTGANAGKVYAPTSGSTTAVKVLDLADKTSDPLSGKATVPDATALGLIERGTGNATSQYSPLANTRLEPGVYTGGINIQNTGVTMKTGVYIIKQGNFTVSNGIGVSSEAGGVLIYLTNYNSGTTYAKFLLSGSTSNATLDPLTGNADYPNPYKLTIFQDANAPVSTTTNQWSITGGSSIAISGILYAPSAALSIQGSGTARIGESMIANKLTLSGSATFVMPTSLIPRQDIRLVE